MWCCPKCKAGIRIFDVHTTVVTYVDGTEVDGDMEWGRRKRSGMHLLRLGRHCWRSVRRRSGMRPYLISERSNLVCDFFLPRFFPFGKTSSSRIDHNLRKNYAGRGLPCLLRASM